MTQTRTQTMTQAQANALSRAQQYDIRILARGTIKATGQRFYVTTSRDGRGQHVVLVGAALLCDCLAGAHGALCCHRAAVHAAISAELATAEAAEVTAAAERNAHISARLATMQHQPAQARQCEDWRSEDARRETSMVARPVGAFSIYK